MILKFEVKNNTIKVYIDKKEKFSLIFDLNNNENMKISTDEVAKFLIEISEFIDGDNLELEPFNEKIVLNENFKSLYSFIYELFVKFFENYQKNKIEENKKIEKELRKLKSKLDNI